MEKTIRVIIDLFIKEFIMSFFGVTVNSIEEIYPHSNADKLELGKVSDCKITPIFSPEVQVPIHGPLGVN